METQEARGKVARGWLSWLTYGFGVLVVLLVVGWAGTQPLPAAHSPPVQAVGDAVPPYLFKQARLATATPTVTLTATATPPPASEALTVYLPLIQKQIFIPGSLSLEQVHTTTYAGSRPATFRPCQAVVLHIRMHNNAGIPQTAALYWQTAGPAGETHPTLSGRKQVHIPPGESTWRFVGSLDQDALAGAYRLQVWFTSGTDHQGLDGSLTVKGKPMPLHFLDGQTAAIDPRHYDLVVPKEIVPGQAYANIPVRITDEFTFEDSDVVQITTWEGAKENSYVETHRFRPDGRRFGNLIQQWREHTIRPNCVRRAIAYWPIDSWVQQTPGQWHFEIFGGESPDDEARFAGQLYFTIQESKATALMVR